MMLKKTPKKRLCISVDANVVEAVKKIASEKQVSFSRLAEIGLRKVERKFNKI